VKNIVARAKEDIEKTERDMLRKGGNKFYEN